MGAILHPLNIRLGPKELAYIIKDAADAVVFVDHDLLPRLAAVSAEGLAPLRLGVVVCGPVYAAGSGRTGSGPRWQETATASGAASELRRKGVRFVADFDQWLDQWGPSTVSSPSALEAACAAFQWPEDIDEQAGAGMCYTSGTTGNPKGVLYSHRSTYIHTLAMPAKDNHDCGGADTYLPVSRFMDSATTLDMAVKFGATHSAAVPAIWQEARAALEQDPPRYAGRLRPMQICCGGSAPSNEMMKWYLATYGIRFAQGWGMTETSPMGAMAKLVSKRRHLDWTDEQRFANVTKAGIPHAGIEMRIVDADDFSKPVPHDGQGQGELLVRGPWVTARYYNSDRGQFPGGWLATGDIASIDAD
eukprot:g3361.t1